MNNSLQCTNHDDDKVNEDKNGAKQQRSLKDFSSEQKTSNFVQMSGIINASQFGDNITESYLHTQINLQNCQNLRQNYQKLEQPIIASWTQISTGKSKADEKSINQDQIQIKSSKVSQKASTAIQFKLRQFPITFANQSVDLISKILTAFGSELPHRVVYMGFRPGSNMKIYKRYCRRGSTKQDKDFYANESCLYPRNEQLLSQQNKIIRLNQTKIKNSPSRNSQTSMMAEGSNKPRQMKKFAFHHSNQTQNYFPIRPQQYRLFIGSNPTTSKQDQKIKFSSDFECGNLDLAVCVKMNQQYDLFMKVDSNTKGHISWYFFSVSYKKTEKSPNNNPCKKIKFNIVNFTKNNMLYQEGMRPYTFKKSIGMWTQEDKSLSNLQFKTKNFRYNSMSTGKESKKSRQRELFASNSNGAFKCLSFTYDFSCHSIKEEASEASTAEYQTVYFAYGIPYSYSYLMETLSILQEKYPDFLKVSLQQESSGGLPFPILTLTSFAGNYATTHNQKKDECVQSLKENLADEKKGKQQNKRNKIRCFITARIHPGQTQGSWMLEGLLHFLCSPQAHYLRENVQFKIIPMVNIDGVVLGNFRTGIGGRDLNRMFDDDEINVKFQRENNKKPSTQISNTCYNQIRLIKKIAHQFRPEIYLDFHGHSAKKNVFIYGPEYRIQDKDYLICRLFPKIISKKIEAFRYYSCMFRIPQCKKNTGRAIMFDQFGCRFVYTIQASAYGYIGESMDTSAPFMRRTYTFDAQKYIQVGRTIASSLEDFIKLLLKLPKRIEILELRKKQKQQEKTKPIELRRNLFSHLQDKSSKSFRKSNSSSGVPEKQKVKYFSSKISLQEKLLIDEILKEDKQQCHDHTTKKKTNLSDSDAESQEEDYSEIQLLNFQSKCIKPIQSQKDQPYKTDAPLESIQKKKKKCQSQQNSIKEKQNQKQLNFKRRRYREKKKVQIEVLSCKNDFTIQSSHSISPNKSRNVSSSFNTVHQEQENIRGHKVKSQQECFPTNSILEKLGKIDNWKGSQLRPKCTPYHRNSIKRLQLLKIKSSNHINFDNPISESTLKKPSRTLQVSKLEPIFIIRRTALPSVDKKYKIVDSSQYQTLIKNDASSISMNLQEQQTVIRNKNKSKSLNSELSDWHERKKQRKTNKTETQKIITYRKPNKNKLNR